MRIFLLAFLWVLASDCLATSPGTPEEVAQTSPPRVSEAELRIDHLVLGINDLQRGIEELERATGVRAIPGGSHPGMGTHNALISLGESHYLEILAPNPQEAVNAPIVNKLRTLNALTPLLWAVRVQDMESFQKRLQERGVQTSEIQSGSRAQLQWRTFRVVEPASPFLPFFIQWGEGSAHPSLTSPKGCALQSFHLMNPEPDELGTTLEKLGLRVTVNRGTQPRLALVLSCPRGKVEF